MTSINAKIFLQSMALVQYQQRALIHLSAVQRRTPLAGKVKERRLPERRNGIVRLEEAKRFMIDCFLASNTTFWNSKAMADLLLEADYRGHYSHGMNRLEMYINDLNKNACNGKVTPKILKETPSTAWVDGQNGLGAVVGNFCMDLAIEKAKTSGAGFVVAKRTNHYGIAGWYTMRATNQNVLGFSMTNTSPLMCPTRSIEPGLGTNPFSFGAPATKGDNFILDMATTGVAVGKIEIQRRKGLPIPLGWAQDKDGNMTTDANTAFEAACLMPIGGSELTSGYKGFGLGAVVEICCGILAGSNFATRIRKWSHKGADAEANLGQCFVAIDPACFAPGFRVRLSDLHSILRNLIPEDPENPVLIAGDPERNNMAKVDREGGIKYTENQIKTNDELAQRLNITPMRFNYPV